MNMTTQYKRWQDNNPDNPDDSSSMDGTYRPSSLSWDDSYPSSRTEDRDWHRCRSHSSNWTQFDNHRHHHGQCVQDHGHDSPSDLSSMSSDRGRWSEMHKSWDDHRSSWHHSCSTPHLGVQERGQCPLIPLHIMSGTMKMTLIKTNTRQNFCVIIKVLFMTE